MRQTLEMLDGRKYFSDDGWETIWESRPVPRPVTDKLEADRIRYLAIVMRGTHEEGKR